MAPDARNGPKRQVMSSIELDSAVETRVALKYQLGEFVLCTWRPHCLVLNPVAFSALDWPEPPLVLATRLTAPVEGVLCRKVDAGRFRVGLSRHGALLAYVRQVDVLYTIDGRLTWDVYLKTLSSKARQNIQRTVRKYAAKQGDEPYFEEFRDPAAMAGFHREAHAISQQTYQSRLLKAGLPGTSSFVEHMQALASAGRARGYLLKDAGKSIAFAWCSLNPDGRLSYEVVGYLPEWAPWSPGTILLYRILEHGFATQQFKLLDFGPGEAQYKSVFATDRVQYADVFFFRDTLKHRALTGFHRSMTGFSDHVVHFLDRLGWKAQIKKWLRRL